MRLLLLSDTHVPARARDLPPEVWAAVDASDVVLHAGDWVDVALLDALEARARRLVGCHGNNDGPALRERLPLVARVELDGLRVGVVHETGPATGRERRCDDAYPDLDLLVFGHSHIPWDTVTPAGLRLLNPGSPTDRRRQPAATYLTATVTTGRLADVELHALVRPRGPRRRADDRAPCSAGAVTAGLTVRFLRDVRHGGAADQLRQTAQALASFVDAAQHSLDIAIYDFRLSDESATTTVVGALTRAADRGVSVRIGYDAGKPAAATAADFAVLEADPAPPGTGEWVTEHFAGTGVEVKAIKAAPQLMHSKYVVRDAPAGGERAAVWTGSTNFTDDAWTRQENNVLTIADAATATAYRTDFDQLWTAGAIAHTGTRLAGSTTLAGGTTVGWDFCPGDGPAIDAALADRIADARSRLVLGAMVLTSHRVLAALAAAVERGVPVSGVYDGGQMDPIVRTWRSNPSGATVLADWKTVSEHLAVKHSTPYTPTGTHDFMHLKVLVADDTVVTGSYNFSANAERNAENQVHLDDPATVTAYAEYLADVAHAYGS